jgi:hypothetical protein
MIPATATMPPSHARRWWTGDQHCHTEGGTCAQHDDADRAEPGREEPMVTLM